MEKLPNIINNEDIIKNYLRFLELQGYKPQTIVNKTWSLMPFFRFTHWKKAENVTQADIENFVISRRKICTQNTVCKNILELRFFFRWMNPASTSMFINVKTRYKKNILPVTAVLTQEEALRIVQAARCQRDRALIFTLWDTGARIGEILSLKVGDVTLDQYGAALTVTGKTGMRRIRIIDSVPDLQLWLNQYPGNVDDWLFPSTQKRGKFTPKGAQHLIKKAAARAGIDKHVFVHLFRHSRLTDLAKKGLNEMELRLIAGWENSSNMPATYLHLSGADVDDKVLAIHGIIPEEKEERVKSTIRSCPRCQTQNPFDAKYCKQCSMILDQKVALVEAQKLSEATQLLEKFGALTELVQHISNQSKL